MIENKEATSIKIQQGRTTKEWRRKQLLRQRNIEKTIVKIKGLEKTVRSIADGSTNSGGI